MLKDRSLWWSKKWGKDKICGIGLNRLRHGKDRENYSYTITLPCNHSFYRKAIIEWLQKCPVEIPTCPTCRTEFCILSVFG